MKNILTTLLVLISYFILPAQVNHDSITNVFEKIARETVVPGFSISIVSKDKVIYKKGFGYANLKNKQAYKPSTIQNIGSTSKTMIGIAIMKAVEQGKFQLDTPINDILPFKVIHPGFPNTPITVRHLAAHTSGIEDSKYYFKSYVLHKPGKSPLKHLNLLQKIFLNRIKKHKKLPLQDFLQNYFTPNGKFYHKKNFGKTQPGTVFEYSNMGASLGALVVEIAVGEPFEVYTRKHIMEPIGMSSTGWSFDKIDMKRHATLYKSKKPRELPLYTLNTFPDGGLLTCSDDLSLYLMEVMKGLQGESDLLSKAAFEEMLKSQVPEKLNQEQNTYGLFWSVFQRGYRGHDGSDPGANSLMLFTPEKNIGVIMIINMDLDDHKKTAPIFSKIWRTANLYARGLPDEVK